MTIIMSMTLTLSFDALQCIAHKGLELLQLREHVFFPLSGLNSFLKFLIKFAIGLFVSWRKSPAFIELPANQKYSSFFLWEKTFPPDLSGLILTYPDNKLFILALLLPIYTLAKILPEFSRASFNVIRPLLSISICKLANPLETLLANLYESKNRDKIFKYVPFML